MHFGKDFVEMNRNLLKADIDSLHKDDTTYYFRAVEYFFLETMNTEATVMTRSKRPLRAAQVQPWPLLLICKQVKILFSLDLWEEMVSLVI